MTSHENNHNDEEDNDRWIGDKPPEPINDYEKYHFTLIDWARCVCGQWMDKSYLPSHVFEYECDAPISGDELV